MHETPRHVKPERLEAASARGHSNFLALSPRFLTTAGRRAIPHAHTSHAQRQPHTFDGSLCLHRPLFVAPALAFISSSSSSFSISFSSVFFFLSSLHASSVYFSIFALFVYTSIILSHSLVFSLPRNLSLLSIHFSLLFPPLYTARRFPAGAPFISRPSDDFNFRRLF